MVILHHSQLSFAHVVPGIRYPIATLTHTYIVHTNYILYTLRPTPIKHMPIMPNMIHGHYASCLYCPISIMPHIRYLQCLLHTQCPPCRLCPMHIILHTCYTPCNLCPIFIILHAHFASCSLWPIPNEF